MQAKRGFTLVEILIVVVILGILAAIVIPQFTQASTEAKTNSLCSDLQSLRSQIELFKCQHTDMPPGNTRDSTGTIADDVPGLFANQMIYCTDEYGNVKGGANSTAKTRDATYKYGPYLERVPANPFNDLDTVDKVTDQANAGSGTNGWDYVPGTGEIFAGDALKTPDGVLHRDL
jgi:general secretion pathway protein G